MTSFAFIGYGEAARCLTDGLSGEGAEIRACYDILFEDAAKGAEVQAAAKARGVIAAPSYADAVKGVDVVVSAVVADQTVQAAKSAAPHLAKGQLYVDVNSTSPMQKREASELVDATGAAFVEAAVMANFPPRLHKTPIFLAGKEAPRFEKIAKALNMDVETVGPDIGQASSIKMFRSVVVKGFDALFIECVLAAGKMGVADRIFQSLNDSFPGQDWEKLANYLLGRAAIHSKRRASEMDKVAETLEEIGVDAAMARATAGKLRWCADIGLKDAFPDGPPETYAEFLKGVEACTEDGSEKRKRA